MNSILDWYQGQNAKYGTGGYDPLTPVLNHAQAATFGGIGQAADFANGLEPLREQNIRQQLGYLSQGGIDAAKNRAVNGVFENANRAGNQAATALRAQGYGDGASGGMMAALLGQGANQANQIAARFDDPNYISSVLQRAYGVINGGMTNPLAQTAIGYQPTIMQQAEFGEQQWQSHGGGLLGQLAPLAGGLMAQGAF